MSTEAPRETAEAFARLRPTRATPEFKQFLEAVRTVQDLAVAIDAPPEVLAEAAGAARALAESLEAYAAPEERSFAGRTLAAGRGHLMLPAWRVDQWTAEGIRARGVFRRFHLGGNGAAHGGAIALLFDEQCGMTIFAAQRPVARTAYLHVNYRKLTPLDVELVVESKIDRVEGRKVYVTIELKDADGDDSRGWRSAHDRTSRGCLGRQEGTFQIGARCTATRDDETTIPEEPAVPRNFQDWNQGIISEFRENNGTVLANGFGRNLVLVHHVGAKSGTARIAPLFAIRQDENTWLIAASKGGAPENPAWFHNLRAHPRVTIETPDDGTVAVEADVLEATERDEAWTKFTDASPGFGRYQEKATRTIPVIALRRTA